MMNIIEKLGGYDRAKSIANCKSGIVHPTQQLLDALLEYRRQHNIFERHDLVVFKDLSFERLFSVRYVGGDSIVIHEVWDEAGARSFSEDKPYSDIRHATDEEIAAGHRL